MTLEKRSASQVVTFAPQQPSYTLSVLSGGTAPSNAAYAAGFAGLAFLVGGTLSAGTTANPGDRFQLWNTGSLKEPTVFTVQGVTPSTGFSSWNVFFTPAPQAIPANGDKAISLPTPTSPRWLGAIGHVSQLAYTFSCPGGPDSMTCLLQLPPNYRTDAINPGRVVQVWRGVSCVWEGKLDEPQPATQGWTITAHGAGNYGADFAATYTAWTADNPVNAAITRGLRWVNPGIGTPAGIYLGQVQDSGAQTIAAFMALLCTGGGLIWQVTQGGASAPPALPPVLSVYTLPADANGSLLVPVTRIIVSTAPVPRTITADINTIVLRYQATADIAATATKKAVAATFATVTVQQAASAKIHGPMEYYLDLSSAGVMTAAAVKAVGNNVLQKYVRASFAGPFTVGPGQLLTQGGVPVDLGCEQAGQICQVMVTDAPYGGEVAAAPLVFMVGEYEFDDDSDTAIITPYQGTRRDLENLITALYPGKFT